MPGPARRERAAQPSALEDATLPFYTIGQVAQILGVQQALLRRLDDQEIVIPDRSQGRQRRYSREDVERLREVIALADEGITLAGVRKVLALRQRVSDLEDELAEERERRSGRSGAAAGRAVAERD